MVELGPQRVPRHSGVGGLLLWHMNSYLEARGALKEVCAFIAREVSARVKGDSAMPFAGDLEDANNVCHERGILP
jgi:hypothetical protein